METKLHPWQQKILVDIESGGIKPGEMMVMMAGRNIGKSIWTAKAIDRLMKDLQNRPVEELVLNEQPVHGARYYTVEPVGGNWIDMEIWCKTVFGEPGDMWDSNDWVWPETARWMQNNRKFWFRNERDRTVFIMRWSSSCES